VAGDLHGYHILHATRAELLREVGSVGDARAAEIAALRLAINPAERSLLERRLLT
jgi:predicted RNA polymerase sigma factor